jgi:Ca2+-binding EF-hand superfamily protein
VHERKKHAKDADMALDQVANKLSQDHIDGQQFFDRFDSDGNGALDLEEASKALRYMGVREELLSSVIDKIDLNHDGGVRVSESMLFPLPS